MVINNLTDLCIYFDAPEDTWDSFVDTVTLYGALIYTEATSSGFKVGIKDIGVHEFLWGCEGHHIEAAINELLEAWDEAFSNHPVGSSC